jgi:saccharopine dehydrogenase (NAD+, L-lysine-forming)
VEIGIRKEDKNIWEARVPLSPAQVVSLIARGIHVVVQSSDIRAFSDEQYRAVGATVLTDVPASPVLFAVKEIPIPLLERHRTYLYFAHVIKGQPHNMAMLQRLLDLECTLIDYERIMDDKGRRLIFFGRHAGLAGMIDTLWALGRRLHIEGHDTPFAQIRQAKDYPNLDAARTAIRAAVEALERASLPAELTPMVFGFAGYGHVSQGAQEILDLLPHRHIEPQELSAIDQNTRGLVKVVFAEQHMAKPRDPGSSFELQEYYKHPERYRGDFARYVPYLTVLVNCIFWTPKYPRLVTRELLHGLYGAGRKPKLRVIGDISIDVEGAIECSLEATNSGSPVYVYLPDEDRIELGIEGHGPVVLAVDNLPCELPIESSQDFGNALLPFIETVAAADYAVGFEELDLPAAIKRAVITHRGRLTPDYEYLREFLTQGEGEAS